jgi:hypothetical protein
VATLFEVGIAHFFICSYLRDQSATLGLLELLLGVCGWLIFFYLCTTFRRRKTPDNGPKVSLDLRLLSWQSTPFFGLLPYKALCAKLGLLDGKKKTKQLGGKNPSQPLLGGPTNNLKKK